MPIILRFYLCFDKNSLIDELKTKAMSICLNNEHTQQQYQIYKLMTSKIF